MIRNISIVACAGLCTSMALGDEPTALTPNAGPVQQIAHIYYNLASGERVITLVGQTQTSGADTGESVPIWCAGIQNTCANNGGYTTSYFYAVDEPTTTSLSTNIAVLDHGDIAKDTVVDCIDINWVIAHPDTDSNLDSVGDGVEGLAGEWTFWDADNGRADDQDTRLPLIAFRFDNLPGNVAVPGFLSGYTASIDLIGGFSSDLSFEIGDSDGDLQGAAFGNCNVDTDGDGIGDGVSVSNADRDNDGNLDSDIDGDGLFDFSWTVRFIQPGTADLDGDGNIDGVPAPTDVDTIGVNFGAPEGTAIDNGDGTWTWDVDETADCPGTGAEDHLAIYAPTGPNGEFVHAQDLGGNFACEGGLIADGGTGYTPPAMLQMTIYGPGDSPCPADFNGDGNLNFFDVSLFLADFGAGGDYNGDGSTNFFDVSAFLSDFSAGCP